jgi:predicted GIY-YIG superfamily endonuclease
LNRKIYLLHFSEPYKQARHYLGSSDNVPERIKDHMSGRGARLTAVAASKGIGMELVRVWDGDRNEERRLKNQKNAPQLCPICNPKVKIDAAERDLIEEYKRSDPD